MPTSSNFNEKSETVCSMAWNHIFMDPAGRVKPCCRFDENVENINFQINDSSLTQVFNSDFMIRLRQKMLAGEKINGCKRCYEEEASGKKSLRQRYNSRESFTKYINIDKPKIEWIEMSISNQCNLACRMCDSRYSSLWYDQELKVYHQTKSKVKIQKSDLKNIDIDFNNIKHIKFTGGEPLIDPAHIKFLEHISLNTNVSKINLNYSTNCTIIPSSDLVRLWKKFDFVEVSLSIDSIVPEEIEYIRWPSTQKKVFSVANDFFDLKKSMNLKLGLRPTMSYLNIVNFDLLFKWWQKSEAQDWFNPTHVTYPDWLSLTILNPSTKKNIEAHLLKKQVEINSELFTSCSQQLINHMNSSQNQNVIEKAKYHLDKIDSYREQNFSFIYKDLLDDSK